MTWALKGREDCGEKEGRKAGVFKALRRPSIQWKSGQQRD